MSKQGKHFGANKVLKANGKILNISTPVVMGIVNVTPDSFFKGSVHKGNHEVLKAVEKMITDGASIIDIGAESSRPGAKPIGIDMELQRLLPVLKLIRNTFPEIFISVDTYRSEVALAVSEIGADMINDISAGELDRKMFKTVAETKLPYCMMHMQGAPENMQKEPKYKNVVKEVRNYLKQKMETAQEAGIKQIIIDPGFGFGKTLEHNYELLNSLESFQKLKAPILVGVSRKGMIQKIIAQSAEDSLNGTSVVNTIALMKGASILRVHDVKEAMEAVKIFNQLK
ncbi:MAG: dihydropteroate synthase [Bacteroidota bacterium]|nr:dihydropteroate synthase [Bacteroidota bacterium]